MYRQQLIDELESGTRALYEGCGETGDFEAARYYWQSLPTHELIAEHADMKRRLEMSCTAGA